jgi:prepilin-type N-terminal cleavage/methylation domain-containing protein
MRNDVSVPRPSETGFGLVELLIAVAIIAIMAAVALPNIGGYIRNYKVRGAAQDVSSELQAARSKAIMTNTNAGVYFTVVDVDSYRWLIADNVAGERLGPLRDLPDGVQFVAATGADPSQSLRFSRLGAMCNPEVSPCPDLATGIDVCTADEVSGARCPNVTPTGANFITQEAVLGGGMTITVIEANTGLQRTVRLSPGGRILPQP